MEQKIINTIRGLAIDMSNQANSGHPGMPLGAAPIGYTIFKNMNINPKNPLWFNRDRFVLSAGHASALLYSLIHLSGFNLSLDDLKNFRQLHSKTPGHPESYIGAGIDATSGPLGQGIASGIGMALAEAILAEKYNKVDFNIVDHYTYVLCSDGDLQEGVSVESSSLAGLWGLGKLIMFYDSNDITLDGNLSATSNDCIKTRYESMNWQYLRVEDGNDLQALENALAMAKLEKNKPTIIEVKTIIGYGSSKQGTSKVHGSPLGKEEAIKVKEFLNISTEEFKIDNDVYDSFTQAKISNGEKKQREYNKLLKKYKEEYPKEYEEFQNAINDKVEVDFSDYSYQEVGSMQATRNSSNDVINYIAQRYPTFMGGSADLSGSVMTNISEGSLLNKNDLLARNINYGVREFAMAAINNGVMLHKGIKIFGGTFFVFSDYLKPAIRLSAISMIPAIYVFSHDSIALGEDGPTHQPIEQLAMLRAMPNVNVIRPADANETLMAWDIAINSKTTPTAIVLSRQNLEVNENTKSKDAYRGAYVVYQEKMSDKIDCLLIATGSEVNLAIASAKELEKDGLSIRVVSMPSRNIFEKQSLAYQNSVIPKNVKKRLVIEMASTFGWIKYALKDNQILGIDTYGESGPSNQVCEEFGFSVENVKKLVKKIV